MFPLPSSSLRLSSHSQNWALFLFFPRTISSDEFVLVLSARCRSPSCSSDRASWSIEGWPRRSVALWWASSFPPLLRASRRAPESLRRATSAGRRRARPRCRFLVIVGSASMWITLLCLSSIQRRGIASAFPRTPVTPDGPAWLGSARSVEAGLSSFFYWNLFRFYSLLLACKIHSLFSKHPIWVIQIFMNSEFKYLPIGSIPTTTGSLFNY
jgi:hypothetical protein